MTNSSKYFHIYFPCPSSRKIVTDDGYLNTIAVKGNIMIDPNLITENVLHVPKFCTNLFYSKTIH